MDAIYSGCIFCKNELPPPGERGRGEHIIPSHIYGSVCIKDVCRSCNSHLGATADVDVLKDARLVTAVLELGLDELSDRMLEQAVTTLEDVETGQKFPGRVKGGTLRLTPQCKGETWFVPEDQVGRIMGGALKKDRPPSMPTEVALNRLNRLIHAYGRIQSGHSVKDNELGLAFRKASARVSHEFKTEEGAGKRLAAKIAYEMLFSSLPFATVLDLEAQLDCLAEYAWSGTGDGESMVFYPSENESPDEPEYSHTINVWYKQIGIVVDVHLFNVVSYRVFVTPSCPELRGPLAVAREFLDMTGMMMTFEPGKPAMKYVASIPHGETTPNVYLAEHL